MVRMNFICWRVQKAYHMVEGFRPPRRFPDVANEAPPYDGFYMLHSTSSPCRRLLDGLGYFYLFSCDFIVPYLLVYFKNGFVDLMRFSK